MVALTVVVGAYLAGFYRDTVGATIVIAVAALLPASPAVS
jgi:hypothetical protein